MFIFMQVKKHRDKKKRELREKEAAAAAQSSASLSSKSSRPRAAAPTATPVLSEDDQFFLERLTTDNYSLPPRVRTPELAWDANYSQRESEDLSRALDDLDLTARNNRAFSLSAETAEVARRFTQVLKGVADGVPAAADDLRRLLEDRNGALARQFERLPPGFKGLVAQLPEQLAAAAAESRGLAELVVRPGAVVAMLKAVSNALRTRWPGYAGSNVIWSVSLLLLLYALWYCHKRG